MGTEGRAVCAELRHGLETAERVWATEKVRLIAVAQSPDAEEYVRIRGAEMTRVEVDLARIELHMHRQVHAG
jgi:hypothetical protein